MKLAIMGGGLCSALLGLLIVSGSSNPELRVDRGKIQDFATSGKLEVIESTNTFSYYLGSALFLAGSATVAYQLLRVKQSPEKTQEEDSIFGLLGFENFSNPSSDEEPFSFPEVKTFEMPKIGDEVSVSDEISDFFGDDFIAKEVIDLPVVDFAKYAAVIDRSLIVSAIPGSGKTSTLRYLMYHIIENTKGRLNLSIVDCKNEDAGFAGLEKTRAYSMFVDMEQSSDFSDKIFNILSKAGKPAEKIPTIFVVDEYNNGLSTLSNNDRITKTNLTSVVKSNVLQLATKGRTKGIKMILTTHSHSTRDLGITENNMHSFYFAFQAVSHSCDAIKAVLSDPNSIIVDSKIRKRLQSQLERYLEDYDSDSSVICLSNVPVENGFGWQLYKLPNYSKNPDIKGVVIANSPLSLVS